MQTQFIQKVVEKLKNDPNVIGLAVAGSFITNEVDEFSDVDLILITKEKISTDRKKMTEYAKSFGDFLSGFTGEHVGEPRVLICMYDNPLLHVDIKFLSLDEFYQRVENPVIAFERDGVLTNVINSTKSEWPKLDYQWLEDRFWTWTHYATVKLGRGEYFEALNFLSDLRFIVLGPLLQVKNGKLPRGLRKVEFNFPKGDVEKLTTTVPQYSEDSLFKTLRNSVELYKELRDSLFPSAVIRQTSTEEKVMAFLDQIEGRKKSMRR